MCAQWWSACWYWCVHTVRRRPGLTAKTKLLIASVATLITDDPLHVDSQCETSISILHGKSLLLLRFLPHPSPISLPPLTLPTPTRSHVSDPDGTLVQPTSIYADARRCVTYCVVSSQRPAHAGTRCICQIDVGKYAHRSAHLNVALVAHLCVLRAVRKGCVGRSCLRLVPASFVLERETASARAGERARESERERACG